MSERGGVAAGAGVSYENWFTAYWFAEALVGEGIQVEPQAKITAVPGISESGNHDEEVSFEVVKIDDLVVTENGKRTFYTIKRQSPGRSRHWTFSDLESEETKVLKDLQEQYLQSPESNLRLVSRDFCDLLSTEAVMKIHTVTTREGIEARLTKRYLQEWDKLKRFYDWSDEALLEFAKKVDVYRITEEELEQNIQNLVKDYVNNPSIVPDLLFTYASKAARFRQKVTKHDLIEYLRKKRVLLTSSLPVEELKESFWKASQGLATRKRVLGESDIHIYRSALDQAMNWVNGDTGNILFLVGHAGTGKTTIMREVGEKLHSEEIPVLALKADNLVYDSSRALEEELKLGDHLEKAIAKVSAHYGKCVLLIDQIDALSLSLSSNRKPLNVFLRLIRRLSIDQNLKIIISCRVFDLTYDDDLNEISRQRDTTQIKVESLSQREVEEVLLQLNIASTVPPDLKELLRTPSNLDVFVAIYDESLKIEEIKTVTDLFERLLDAKISPKTEIVQKDSKSIYELLNSIASEMHKKQQISVPRVRYKNAYPAQLSFLTTQGILVENGKRIQFFHQSFLDFIFARSIVEKGESLFKLVVQEHQGLFVRSMIRQVLSYLREADELSYHEELDNFLRNANADLVRFHLKVLILQHLALVAHPSSYEKALIADLFEASGELSAIFLEARMSPVWISTFNQQDFLNQFLRNKPSDLYSPRVFLANALKVNPQDALEILSRVEVEDKGAFIIDRLFFLDDWSYSKATELFDKYENDQAIDIYTEQSCFEKAVLHQSNWFKTKLLDRIKRRFSDEVPEKLLDDSSHEWELDDQGNHFRNDRKFLSEPEVEGLIHMFQVNGTEAYELSLALTQLYDRYYIDYHNKYVIPSIRQHFNPEEQEISLDSFYSTPFSPLDKFELESSSGYRLSKQLKEYLEKVIASDEPNATCILNSLSKSNNVGLLILAINIIRSYPKRYKDIAFEIFNRSRIIQPEISSQSLISALRDLLHHTHGFWSLDQQSIIHKKILAYEPPKRYLIRVGNTDIQHNLNRNGVEKYLWLREIPIDQLKSFPNVLKVFRELSRKFQGKESHFDLLQNKRNRVSKTRLSIMSNNALQGVLRDISKPEYGNTLETGQDIKVLAKNNPQRFLALLYEIKGMPDIKDIFSIYILEALTESDSFMNEARPIYTYYMGRYKYFDDDLKRTFLWLFKKFIGKIGISSLSFQFLRDIISDTSLDPIVLTHEIEPPANRPVRSLGVANDHPRIIHDLLTNFINTTRGYALLMLLELRIESSLENQVFELMEFVKKDNSILMRVGLAQHIAHLGRLNQLKTHKLFLELMNDENPYVISSCSFSLPYLMHYDFGNLRTYFLAAMKVPYMQENIGKYLLSASWNQYEGSNELLELAINHSEKALKGALHTCTKYFVQDHFKTAYNILFICRFVNHPSSDIQHTISGAFKYFDRKDYFKIKKFINSFIKSIGTKTDLHFFYRYILKCSSIAPKDCIQILTDFQLHHSIGSQGRRLTDKPFRSLISAYQAINTSDMNAKEQAMDILDKMLKDKNIRIRVLGKVDTISNEYSKA